MDDCSSFRCVTRQNNQDNQRGERWCYISNDRRLIMRECLVSKSFLADKHHLCVLLSMSLKWAVSIKSSKLNCPKDFSLHLGFFWQLGLLETTTTDLVYNTSLRKRKCSSVFIECLLSLALCFFTVYIVLTEVLQARCILFLLPQW